MNTKPLIVIWAAALIASSGSMAVAQNEPLPPAEPKQPAPVEEPPPVQVKKSKGRSQATAARDQATVARDQAEALKDQLKDQFDNVREKVEAANEFARANVDFQFHGGDFDPFDSKLMGRSTVPALVIQNKFDAVSQANMQEDLAVMGRILARALPKDGRGDQAMGIILSGSASLRRPQNLYLEGYGAVFMLNVRFPLVAPPANVDTKAEPATNTTWEQTKRELYGNDRGNTAVWINGRRDEPAMEFDQGRVDELKDALIDALKNVSHIRNLKGDEYITLAITGGGTGDGHAKVMGGKNGEARVMTLRTHTVINGDVKDVITTPGSGKTTTMILRAKKSDIDAFASGKKSSDDFKQNLQVQAY